MALQVVQNIVENVGLTGEGVGWTSLLHGWFIQSEKRRSLRKTILVSWLNESDEELDQL